jgi:predicted glycogen debranching enzyme
VIANLNAGHGTTATWDMAQSGLKGKDYVDLLTEEKLTITVNNQIASCLLDPGQVRCLSTDSEDLLLFCNATPISHTVPHRIELQQKRAKVLEILKFFRGVYNLEDFDLDQAAMQLGQDPVALCRNFNPFSREPRVIPWHWPRDERREVMIPPGHFLLIRSQEPFRASIHDGKRTVAHEQGLRRADGSFFALFSPLPTPKSFQAYTLKLTVYYNNSGRHSQAPLLYLPHGQEISVPTVYHRSELLRQPLLFLGTNGRGGMLRASVSWGELNSRYDALLAANINSELPEDRWILFTRSRAWIVFQGYSQEIGKQCLDLFRSENDSKGFWQFRVPTGQGEHILLTVGIETLFEKNAIRMFFYRHPSKGKAARLGDEKKVRLILRPDIESRSFHETTKAYAGPEQLFPASVEKHPTGFTFAPDPSHGLTIKMTDGTFVWEPEWYYMVHRPAEAKRGLDPYSDLFSPGYFAAEISGGQLLDVTAHASDSPVEAPLPLAEIPALSFSSKTESCSLENTLSRALDHFVVKRGLFKTIIAGYPWFLDWGRDTLIVVRGLIADGRTREARDILMQFARFEDRGTLPNMIHGNDAGNRDTSDAALWFYIAAHELVRYEGDDSFLNATDGRRTLRETLVSMGRSIMTGTPNGIQMDRDSGLLFSPGHFTWMDTNYPAGSPRQGYPIEIQALWYAALSFLSRIDPEGAWKETAYRVQASVKELFFLKELGYLSDCRHADPGMSAAAAEPDDALRPNQLFAITMNVVKDRSDCQKIVSVCQELLVPGAIRSLADRPVHRPLGIHHHEKLLNDPYRPYQGRYAGDEDTCRKPAYHNGTAWTWVFPSFCEAWVKSFGIEAKKTALSWLASCLRLLYTGCIGQIPEILDGDYPHEQRGCDAQAWGVSEALRVWKQLAR